MPCALTQCLPPRARLRRARVRAVPLAALLCAALAAGGGCGDGGNARPRLLPETEDALFKDAAAKSKNGDRQGAIGDLLRLNASRLGEAPETNYELAGLYYAGRDWLSAIHHYRAFLRLAPRDRRAPVVRSSVDHAGREFMKTMPSRDLDPAGQLVMREQLDEYRRTNDRLALENQRLQTQVAELMRARSIEQPFGGGDRGGARGEALPANVVAPAVPPPPAPAGLKRRLPGTYTVQQGDSLYKISTRIYGTPLRWKEIRDANPDKFPKATRNRRDDPSVQIGWVLKIPPG